MTDRQRVAFAGLGTMGLGMARNLARAGFPLALVSRTLAKADDALRMGATHVFATEDPATFEEREGSLDLIINTISAPIRLGAHLRLLDVDGVMVQVGVPPEPMSLHMYPLLGGRRSLAGSPNGGLPETQEMLDVAAAHGFGADIETIEAPSITAAHDRVVAGDPLPGGLAAKDAQGDGRLQSGARLAQGDDRPAFLAMLGIDAAAGLGDDR